MDYKGFDISVVVDVQERQEIDERGNSIAFRDSWLAGEMQYQADRNGTYLFSDSFDDIKELIDAYDEED